MTSVSGQCSEEVKTTAYEEHIRSDGEWSRGRLLVILGWTGLKFGNISHEEI